jgi:hypothetical protein
MDGWSVKRPSGLMLLLLNLREGRLSCGTDQPEVESKGCIRKKKTKPSCNRGVVRPNGKMTRYDCRRSSDRIRRRPAVLVVDASVLYRGHSVRDEDTIPQRSIGTFRTEAKTAGRGPEIASREQRSDSRCSDWGVRSPAAGAELLSN